MVKKKDVLERLKEVIDPELNVSIVDLGLVYEIEVKPRRKILKPSFIKITEGRGQVQDDKEQNVDIYIKMTLTSPGCPLADVFHYEVTDAVKKIKGVRNVTVELVWEPMWTPDRMSEEAKEKAGLL